MTRKGIKSFLLNFSFLPFVKKRLERGCFDLGLETYIVNSFFQVFLRFNTNFLLHFTSKAIISKNIKVQKSKESKSVYQSFAASGGCYYQAMNGIEIGEGTLWAFGCKIISANHKMEKGKLQEHDIDNEPVRIGKYVWLGANVVVLPKVQIGDYVVVGAGAVVTKNIPAYSIAVGNPARVVGVRCEICLNKVEKNKECNCNLKK